MSPGGSSCSRASLLATGAAALVFATVVAVAVAASPRMTLVLAGGSRVEVSDAQLRGDEVLVTRLDGRRVRVASSRVDLVGSGLADDAPATRFGAGPALVDVDRIGTAAFSGATITDAHVGHVGGDGEPVAQPGATLPAASGSGLTVSAVEHVASGGHAVVRGAVTNGTGQPVEAVLVDVAALAADHSQLGHATTSVDGPLEPGESRRFSVAVAVSGPPDAVRVHVSAPVRRVVFDID